MSSRNLTPEQKAHKKAQAKEYYQENKEQIKLKVKRYKEENSEQVKAYEKTRNQNLTRKEKSKARSKKESNVSHRRKRALELYNLTPDDYNQMFEAQEGKCLICGTHQSDLKKKLFVDHCHTTGKVRGLLCHKCNSGIGYLNDDLLLVTRAMEYLQEAA